MLLGSVRLLYSRKHIMESGDYYIRGTPLWSGVDGAGTYSLTTIGSSIYPAPPPSIKNLFRSSAGRVSRSGRPSLYRPRASPPLFPLALVHGNLRAISSLRTLPYQPFRLVKIFFRRSLGSFSKYPGLGALARATIAKSRKRITLCLQ